MRFESVAIIGDGAMGSVCAMLLAENGVDATMWGHNADYLQRMAQTRQNVLFLPGHRLPDTLRFISDDADCFDGAQLIVSAVPCQFMRQVWQRLKPHLPPSIPIVSVAKGIELGTLLRPTQILADVLGTDRPYAVLSGPTIADELARRLPASATVACEDTVLAKRIQKTFATQMFRLYTHDDLVGVELAGAMKNVIAIAAGAIDGIGAGDNAKAALLCRGLAEITRLGVALGARQQTFYGLSGLGDLVTTCFSPLGRNRSFGQRIGQGQTAQQALAATPSVVEGVPTCSAVLELAKKHHIEMPITEAIEAVITGKKAIKQAIADLMSRQLKEEF